MNSEKTLEEQVKINKHFIDHLLEMQQCQVGVDHLLSKKITLAFAVALAALVLAVVALLI